MVWAESKFLGCGYVECAKDDDYKSYLVCNYEPAGNIVGKPIYPTD